MNDQEKKDFSVTVPEEKPAAMPKKEAEKFVLQEDLDFSFAVPAEPTSLVWPGIRWANSALIWNILGCVACIQGILSSKAVKPINSVR